MIKVGIISLGCPRNLVDSEVILGSLKDDGFRIEDVEKGVDICIINTCAFIDSAREESVDAILQAGQLKKEGKIKHLVVCGCLPQLYRDKLLKELPGIDLILGTNDFPKIRDAINKIAYAKRRSIVSRSLNYIYDDRSPRFILTPRHYAYVKVCEGCSNFCSYCIISRLRGRFRSRTIESIIEEIKGLSNPSTLRQAQGRPERSRGTTNAQGSILSGIEGSKDGALKEINLIGQDTTLFGIDRYGGSKFSELLKRICKLKNSVRWVRILYTHPAHYTDELISTIRNEDKICKYLDLPIQHITDRILKAMNRKVTKVDIIRLIEKLRKNVHSIVLRTSIIVGFPGETDSDFKELLDFIRETRFERLGAFIYSKEKATKASKFKNQISEEVKRMRFDEVMKIQQKISSDINRTFFGRKIEVLIEEEMEGEKDKFLGRTQGDAPEVDGTVYVSGKNLKTGEFYKVKIMDTLEYDLIGEALSIY